MSNCLLAWFFFFCLFVFFSIKNGNLLAKKYSHSNRYLEMCSPFALKTLISNMISLSWWSLLSAVLLEQLLACSSGRMGA